MRESVRIVRFCLIGTMNALITALVIGGMMEGAGADYLLANVTAYVVAQTHNFVWSKYWIFPLENTYRKSSTWRQVLLFSVAFALAYGLQFLFLLLVVEGFGMNEYLGQFLGLFVYGAVNFLANKHVTFR